MVLFPNKNLRGRSQMISEEDYYCFEIFLDKYIYILIKITDNNLASKISTSFRVLPFMNYTKVDTNTLHVQIFYDCLFYVKYFFYIKECIQKLYLHDYMYNILGLFISYAIFLLLKGT